jgi:hypothetical protein
MWTEAPLAGLIASQESLPAQLLPLSLRCQFEREYKGGRTMDERTKWMTCVAVFVRANVWSTEGQEDTRMPFIIEWETAPQR